jgi:beta-glucanase (GH16 family)
MALLFSGQLNFGDKCLDHQGNSGIVPILATPNDSPSQSWQLYDGNDGDFNMLYAPSMNMSLRTDTLLLDAPWYNSASPQQWFIVQTNQLQAGAGPNTMQPTTDGTSIQLALPPVPPGWSFSAQSPPPLTGDFAPSGYTFVQGDEFTAANLDTTKWWTRGSYSGGTQDHDNDVVSRYRESGNHVMTGNTLQLTLLGNGVDGVGTGLYPTGMIRSKFTIPLASGDGFYIAIRAKVPNGLGTWSAFWLAPDDRTTVPSWPPELGPMEIITNATRTTEMIGLDIQTNGEAWPGPIFNTTVTSDQGTNWSGAYNLWFAPFNANEDFHVYALKYKGGNWWMTVDGTLISNGTYNWNYTVGVPANNANIICNLEFGGSTGGTGGLTTSFPQIYELDWVRVYQENGTSSTLGVSTIGEDLMPSSGG